MDERGSEPDSGLQGAAERDNKSRHSVSSDETSQELQITVSKTNSEVIFISDTMDEVDNPAAVSQDKASGHNDIITSPFSDEELLTFDDENRSNAKRFYLNTMEPLHNRFDGKVENLESFVFNVSDRVAYAKWENITHIMGYDYTMENLINNFELVHLSHVRENA
jgi:hypothetical protein